MKIAIVGSRNMIVYNIGNYVSDGDEIVTGGAAGIDRCAAEYAKKNGLKLTEFLPQYKLYGRAAPIARNKKSLIMQIRSLQFETEALKEHYRL